MTASQVKTAQKPQPPNKPRLVRYHELKPLLLERLGATPRLNIRSGEVWAGSQRLSADRISRLYLELSSDTEQWPIIPTADAVMAMAEANEFDPVADFLNGLADHTPLPLEQWHRLDQWLLGIDDPVAADFLPQFFISAVARTLTPGCEARCSPVLVGEQQRGKTTLGRILFGADHWVEGLADLSRDSRMRCQTAWAVELSELDGITRRSDVEALKCFLSEREDSFRKPYGKGVQKMPRRFVFWGTSNGAALRDITGNTRFQCFRIPDGRMLPLDWAISHRNALWARAVEQFRSGVDWTRVSEQQRQQRKEANEQFLEIDPWAEAIGSTLATNQANGYARLSDFYDKLELPAERQNNGNARRIRQLAEAMGWKYGQRRVRGTVMRGFWWEAPVPVKAQEGEDDDIDNIF